ncbi:MAG: GTP-binding protein, partial [Myxococcota bacterium]
MQPSERELLKTDIHEYLRRYERKELLRFVAVGSVDDGKSTLIGRLLHDTEMVYDDQVAAVQAASSMPDGEMDFSLFTDGLAAEREQGITIDVAYRYFATEKRKFIIADTPGHVQYTRNMVTGASTANVAIILVDARLGVLQQSRRHAYIASMLGIPHLLVAVNKMDLVGFDPQVFERIRDSFRDFSKNLRFKDVTFIPISALKGVHVARRTRSSQEGQGAAQPPGANIDTAAAWYEGPTVLEYLETVPISLDRNFDDLRYPVQYVVRPDLNYRGFAGQIASGVLRTGDEVVALPSGRRSRVRSIDTMEGALEEAFTPMSVCLRLEDEIDVSRGDILCRPDNLPRVGRKFDAHLVWMSEKGLDPQKSYVLK